MTLEYILQNDKLNKFLESSISKTYAKYKLSAIVDKDDFYQETCIYIMNNIKKFDESKSSIKSYLPLLIMTYAKRFIMLAHGQSKNNDKLDFHRSMLSLDLQYQNESDGSKFDNLISDKNNNLESILMNKLMIDNILQSKILTESQQKTIELMLKGYNQREIGEILGCTTNNITLHFKNAKKKILTNFRY